MINNFYIKNIGILILLTLISSCSNNITSNPHLIKLNKNINTDGPEYSAYYEFNSGLLYYSTFVGDQNIYVSKKIINKSDSTKYSFSQPIDINRLMDSSYTEDDFLINTGLNEGSAIISYDGNSLYFVGCNRSNGFGSCDIYVSTKNKQNKWTKPVILDKTINFNKFESYPTISKDNKTLFFVSTRAISKLSDGDDIINNYNIWYSRFNDLTNKWGKANIVENINTKDVETSPFISEDGLTLYFSSNKGENHLGRYDIYKSVYNTVTEEWSKPINLGSEINSEQDELYFRIDYKNNIGYLTKSNLSGFDNFKLDVKYYLDKYIPTVPYPLTKISKFNSSDTYDVYMIELSKIKL